MAGLKKEFPFCLKFSLVYQPQLAKPVHKAVYVRVKVCEAKPAGRKHC